MPIRITVLLFLLASVVFSTAPALADDDAVALIPSASPAEGERLFLRCRACHTIAQGGANRLGPNLWGVVGRPKTSIAGFNYSAALKRLTGAWDYASLASYLRDPRGFAPGNRMVFPGIRNDAQLAALIAYLRTQATIPVALPGAARPTAPGASGAASAAPEPAELVGLPAGEGREEVAAICGACHSLRIVTQQGLDRDRWDSLMDWMTEKQGMPELPPVERKRVVSYLAEHFGPDRGRRPAVNPMMPAMPAMPPAMPPMPGG